MNQKIDDLINNSKSLFTRLGISMAILVAVVFVGFLYFRPARVEIVKPYVGKFVRAVYATGTVEPTVMLPIAPRYAARLVELNADEGAQVTKDQQLGKLEDTDLLNTITELTAREKFASEEFDRAEKLFKSGYTTRQELDRTRSNLNAAQAALNRAEAQAGFMRLLSPADGTIIKRDGEIGELIPANQPVFWLSCCAPLRVSTEVDEEDIALVKEGQETLISTEAFPGQVFQGTVQNVTPKGDPVSRSYRVRVSLPEDSPLKIGMTAETNIIVKKSDNSMLIPATAVTDGKAWVVENSKVSEKSVTTGLISNGKTEVLDGLSASDLVVANPAKYSLTPGSKIRTRLVEMQ